MAIANSTVVSTIKPLEGAVVRRYIAGAAITPGDAVCMSSDGYIDPADSDALSTNTLVGIALCPRNQAMRRVTWWTLLFSGQSVA